MRTPHAQVTVHRYKISRRVRTLNKAQRMQFLFLTTRCHLTSDFKTLRLHEIQVCKIHSPNMEDGYVCGQSCLEKSGSNTSSDMLIHTHHNLTKIWINDPLRSKDV